MDLVKTMQPVSDPRQSVLIIDDNPADAERLRRYIAQYDLSISTIILENTSQVAKILAEYTISVVFIDQYIGASTGTRVIKSQKKRFPKIPFILLTGFGDEQVACEAIRAGAMDYLRKNSLNAARIKSILTNITSHWLKDKTISDQNTKLSQQAAIIDATSDAVVYTNARGEIIFVNSAAQGMLALPSAEKQPSLTLQDICSETYTALIKTCILPTLQSGNTWSGDIALQSGVAGDAPLPVSVVAFPLKNNAGGVTAYAAIMRDITEKQQREAALYHAANHDALTGLANRSMIMTTLAHSIKRAERDRHTFALLFLDLDHFKGINDTLGHHMGDILLKGIARRLQSTARGGDHIGRIGGDEFVIIMDVEQNSDAAQLAKRILTLMKEPIVIGSETIYVSSSIGIALFPQCGRQPDVLLSKADMAMYRAKSSGRNRFLFYTEDLLLAAKRQEEGKQNLCQKLQRNDFFMVHQAITDRTGATIGWEALVRC